MADGMIGSSFGPYRIDDKLGQGGMGVVYKAFDTTLHRPVALKMIHADRKESGDGMSEARFMREARAASRLQHPAIVTIHHFGVEDSTEYIVMEFVEGKSLRKLIHDEPMPLDQIFDIAIQIAEGLAAAHEANIIHRDLKADNVMVTNKGQVKILDFGLAKLKDPAKEKPDDVETMFYTQEGLAVGTATHMSPEQAMGRDVDGKSDVFSFGVVLYHMATGKVPFSGANPTITMARILESEAVPVRQLNPNIPQPLEELINRCLQKNRMFRPSAHDVMQSLKELRDFSKAPAGAAAAAAVAAAPSMSAAAPGPVISPTPTPGAAGQAAAPVPVVIVGMQTPSGIRPIERRGTQTPNIPAVERRRSTDRPSQSQAAAAAPAPATAPSVKKSKRGPLYWPLKLAELAISFVLLAAAALLALYFVAGGLPVLGHDLEKFRAYAQVKSIIAPAVAYFHKIIRAHTVVKTWDFMPAGMIVLLMVVRKIALWPLERIEAAFRQ